MTGRKPVGLRNVGRVAIVAGLAMGLAACTAPPPGPTPTPTPQYANQSDPANGGAAFVGSTTCAACHPDLADQHRVHGHAHPLSAVEGGAPEFPAEATRAGVPNPPAGFEWADIAYLIGGYSKNGRFVDTQGFIITTGTQGIPAQWNLAFPANGTEAGLADYEPDQATPLPYDYECFKCHTTGAMPPDGDDPAFQDGLPGIAGTWHESGVQCETCHGPGSRHVADPTARDLYVDPGSATCAGCHSRSTGEGDRTIRARDGFIEHYEQSAELLASGGHAAFNCATCHDPHISTLYARNQGLLRTCTDCHPNATMAGHGGLTFVRGDYRETLSCESCHMPLATRNGSNADASVAGGLGRIGDTRTHIFRISTAADDYTGFFTADGSAVALDGSGQAAVTLDFVCLRCHNGSGDTFPLTVEIAATVAPTLHDE
jgi:hypothetical protein